MNEGSSIDRPAMHTRARQRIDTHAIADEFLDRLAREDAGSECTQRVAPEMDDDECTQEVNHNGSPSIISEQIPFMRQNNDETQQNTRFILDNIEIHSHNGDGGLCGNDGNGTGLHVDQRETGAACYEWSDDSDDERDAGDGTDAASEPGPKLTAIIRHFASHPKLMVLCSQQTYLTDRRAKKHKTAICGHLKRHGLEIIFSFARHDDPSAGVAIIWRENNASGKKIIAIERQPTANGMTPKYDVFMKGRILAATFKLVDYTKFIISCDYALQNGRLKQDKMVFWQEKYKQISQPVC